MQLLKCVFLTHHACPCPFCLFLKGHASEDFRGTRAAVPLGRGCHGSTQGYLQGPQAGPAMPCSVIFREAFGQLTDLTQMSAALHSGQLFINN